MNNDWIEKFMISSFIITLSGFLFLYLVLFYGQSNIPSMFNPMGFISLVFMMACMTFIKKKNSSKFLLLCVTVCGFCMISSFNTNLTSLVTNSNFTSGQNYALYWFVLIGLLAQPFLFLIRFSSSNDDYSSSNADYSSSNVDEDLLLISKSKNNSLNTLQHYMGEVGFGILSIISNLGIELTIIDFNTTPSFGNWVWIAIILMLVFLLTFILLRIIQKFITKDIYFVSTFFKMLFFVSTTFISYLHGIRINYKLYPI